MTFHFFTLRFAFGSWTIRQYEISRKRFSHIQIEMVTSSVGKEDVWDTHLSVIESLWSSCFLQDWVVAVRNVMFYFKYFRLEAKQNLLRRAFGIKNKCEYSNRFLFRHQNNQRRWLTMSCKLYPTHVEGLHRNPSVGGWLGNMLSVGMFSLHRQKNPKNCLNDTRNTIDTFV